MTARKIALAFAACTLTAGFAFAQQNTGKYVWNDTLRIEFRPDAAQQEAIRGAIAKGAKSITLKLTEEQSAWVRKNYGFSAAQTAVRLPKAPPPTFTVAGPNDLSYEFREFYAMTCSAKRGKARCTAVRLPLQIESGPGGTRPSQEVQDSLKVQPVFTPSQRKAFEQARREGKPGAAFRVTASQSKALSKVGEAKAGETKKLEFMAAPEPARIFKQDKLHALGCTMNWQAWCDKYGCHELCYPQCD